MKDDFSILGRNVNVSFSSFHISSAAVEKDTALNHANICSQMVIVASISQVPQIFLIFFHFSVIWLNCFFSLIGTHKFLSSCLIDYGFRISLGIHYHYIRLNWMNRIRINRLRHHSQHLFNIYPIVYSLICALNWRHFTVLFDIKSI